MNTVYKFQIISIMLILLGFSAAQAQVILVVDNRASAPTGGHIFSDFQAALDSAANYSVVNSNETVILHVIPSSTNYGLGNVTSPVEIYGIGFNPDKDIPLKSNVTDINLNAGSSGSRISGLTASNEIDIAQASGAYSVSNISIENCNVRAITVATACCTARTAVDNIIIRNSIIGTFSNASGVPYMDFNSAYATATNVIVTNCIIGGESDGIVGSVDADGILIKNSLFLGDGTTSRNAFYDLTNSTINNNIFLGRDPGHSQTNSEGNIFNNNISFNTGDTGTLPPLGTGNGNTGTGNLESTDPQLTNISLGDEYLFSFDITPIPAGAAENGATDGTDIGPTGGSIAWDNNGVPLPLVQEINTTEIIKQGEDLDVNIKARGN